MTSWSWWWIEAGDLDDVWQGDRGSREKVVADAQRELPPGTSFFIIEARSSENMKYEGADCVPFLRTRNKELLTNGPIAASPYPPGGMES